MPKMVDITGERYGRLVVIERAGTLNGHVAWKCECDCGKVIVTRSCDLRNKKTTSCGCFHNEMVSNITRSHDKCNTRLYSIYNNMRQRCYNSNRHDFSRYGGRGITVCDEWLNDFQAFYDWAMANGYSDELTLDRKDNDKGYEPSNCKWATYKEQRINQRRTKTQAS